MDMEQARARIFSSQQLLAVELGMAHGHRQEQVQGMELELYMEHRLVWVLLHGMELVQVLLCSMVLDMVYRLGLARRI
jgi:hypothetical protein